MTNKPLVFEASAFRDWALYYCQLSYQIWVNEFKAQYGWGISDLCFTWNGKITTMYRAPEEHLQGLFNLVEHEIKKDEQFLFKTAEAMYSEVTFIEPYFKKLIETDFKKIPWQEFLIECKAFDTDMQKPYPKMFISMYFPQAIELVSEKYPQYKTGAEALTQARSKIDHILGPLGNVICTSIGQAVVSRIGLPEQLGRFISREEIFEIVGKEGIVSEDWKTSLESALKERSHYFLEAGGKVWQCSIEEYLFKHGWTLKKENEQVSEFKGTVAFVSDQIIKGEVKVIHNQRELDKVKEGDIIVAPMTTPEYAPIFSKVRAIITDEGGITSHAAIVARELKIPTIIGTKMASKVLKDGMMVEVDAEKGIVKIIK